MRIKITNSELIKYYLTNAEHKFMTYNVSAPKDKAIMGLIAEDLFRDYLVSKKVNVKSPGTIVHNKKTYDRGDYLIKSKVYDLKTTFTDRITYKKRKDVKIDKIIGCQCHKFSKKELEYTYYGILDYGAGKTNSFGNLEIYLYDFDQKPLIDILETKDAVYKSKQILKHLGLNYSFTTKQHKAFYQLIKSNFTIEEIMNLFDLCKAFKVDPECASQFIRCKLTLANKQYHKTRSNLYFAHKSDECLPSLRSKLRDCYGT